LPRSRFFPILQPPKHPNHPPSPRRGLGALTFPLPPRSRSAFVFFFYLLPFPPLLDPRCADPCRFIFRFLLSATTAVFRGLPPPPFPCCPPFCLPSVSPTLAFASLRFARTVYPLLRNMTSHLRFRVVKVPFPAPLFFPGKESPSCCQGFLTICLFQSEGCRPEGSFFPLVAVTPTSPPQRMKIECLSVPTGCSDPYPCPPPPRDAFPALT